MPYDFYKAFADTYTSVAEQNKIEGQKSTEKMLANVDVPSSVAPKESKQDDFLAGLTKGMGKS